jgi:hypothetical protein
MYVNRKKTPIMKFIKLMSINNTEAIYIRMNATKIVRLL